MFQKLRDGLVYAAILVFGITAAGASYQAWTAFIDWRISLAMPASHAPLHPMCAAMWISDALPPKIIADLIPPPRIGERRIEKPFGMYLARDGLYHWYGPMKLVSKLSAWSINVELTMMSTRYRYNCHPRCDVPGRCSALCNALPLDTVCHIPEARS